MFKPVCVCLKPPCNNLHLSAATLQSLLVSRASPPQAAAYLAVAGPWACRQTSVCTGAMATTGEMAVDMVAAFQTAAQQDAFSKVFRLAESSGVNLTTQEQPSTAAAVQSDPQAAGSSSHGVTSSWWDTSTFFKHLRCASMGTTLLSTPSIPSTQEFMRQHASVLPQGTVLVADQQTKGKGRGGNVWTSPAGCLMFTAFRQLQVSGAQAPFINYVVCLAVVRGIKDATQHLLPGGLDVHIKWPNDIYYQGTKIGGALIHTTWAASSQQFCVLTGIGLNVSNSQPTTCLDDIIASRLASQQQQQQQDAGSLQQQAAQPPLKVCKEQLLAAVLTHLESCFNTFEGQGFAPLMPHYLASWMHSNQVVQLADDAAAAASSAAVQSTGGGGSSSSKVPLTIVGLSPHGFLLAKDPLGQEYELTPDGNSLDMMQGLIKKKLS